MEMQLSSRRMSRKKEELHGGYQPIPFQMRKAKEEEERGGGEEVEKLEERRISSRQL
jgi:hypothetical protein